MSAIAHEVSRRMTPEYAKERATDMARSKAYEAKDRAVESDWFMPLLGAGLGALIGKAVLGRMQDHHEGGGHRSRSGHDYSGRGYSSRGFEDRGYDRSYEGYGYGRDAGYRGSDFDRYGAGYGAGRGEWESRPAPADTYVEQVEIWAEAPAGGTSGDLGGPGIEERGEQGGSDYQRRAAEMKDRMAGKTDELRQRAGERASDLGHRAAEMKDRMAGKSDDLRHRAGEYGERLRHQAEGLRDRIPDRDAIRSSATEQAGIWAVGALALGALFGFAVPMTRKEREVLEPARRKVREATEQAKDMALEKGNQALDQAESKVEAQGDEGGEASDDETRSTEPREGTKPGSLPFEPLH